MSFLSFDNRIIKESEKALDEASEFFAYYDKIGDYNQQKVLSAFIDNKVTEADFGESTGYGYSDRGRDKLDKIFADVFGAQDAIVRHNFTCGTHTLSVALFGVLRPGDTMLCVTGTPYDTIHNVIGISGNGMGSLKDFGIKYKQTDLDENGEPDWSLIEQELKSNPKMVYIQRSKGYSARPSLSVEKIKDISDFVHKRCDAIIMVDNCYGEFVEMLEPTQVGADLMAGSLIKNPGGGLARTGGYIAGKKELIELCSYRATTPGLGKEVGCTIGQNRDMFMGFFNAPSAVINALKTGIFAATLFDNLGFNVSPHKDEIRHDIIQTISLENAERLIEFCRGIQKGSPVDSFVAPEPWDMPGYDSKVIMAAGTFILGASIELSADAPLREPFAVWMQGGVQFTCGKTAVMMAAENLLKAGLLK